MKIAVISNARRPTLPDGPHGLGRSAHDIASGLAGRGHDVTLYAGPGSEFEPGRLVVGQAENQNAEQALDGGFDAILDTSHQHRASGLDGHFPIVNRVGDRECDWNPPNAVVNSRYMQSHYPGARHVSTGVRVEDIPFYAEAAGYLAYMSGRHAHKGWDVARSVAGKVGRPIREAQNLTGKAKWDFLGGALALLHPSTIDAAPRTPLEAAACGVPTLCLGGDGAQEHVNDAITGFVCEHEDAMAVMIEQCHVAGLDRRRIRRWVSETHGFEQMVDGYELLLAAVADGERW